MGENNSYPVAILGEGIAKDKIYYEQLLDSDLKQILSIASFSNRSEKQEEKFKITDIVPE